MTRFTVSVVCHLALPQAKACLASLVQSTQPFKLVLTANGNPEAAKFFTEFAVEFPQFETCVLVNERNEGYIEPQKEAFKRCETEFWIMLNDDTIVPPDWLEKFVTQFEQHPKAALSAPKGGCQSLLPSFFGVEGKMFEYLNGACLCCKAEIVREHGLFDPHLKFAYGDDSDLSLRMRERGYTLHYADFKIRHEPGTTSKRVKEVRGFVEHNHAYLRRRWAHYLTHRKMDFPILIRRGGAWGDVLLTTSIIRALREAKPLSPLYVETGCAEILRDNPHIVKASVKIHRTPDMRIINLDGAYEAVRARHYVASYAERAEVEVKDFKTDLFLSEADVSKAHGLMPTAGWISVHCGPCAWKSRDWPADRFITLIANLQAAGHRIVLVGSPGRGVTADMDMRGKTTIHEMAAIIQRTRLFIGIDSLPFHLAESVGTPAFGIFGITDPQYVSTRPDLTACICSTAPSFGLRHRVVGQTVVDDGGTAMNAISAEDAIRDVRHFLDVLPLPDESDPVLRTMPV